MAIKTAIVNAIISISLLVLTVVLTINPTCNYNYQVVECTFAESSNMVNWVTGIAFILHYGLMVTHGWGKKWY